MAEHTREFFDVHPKSVKLFMEQQARRPNERESLAITPKGSKIRDVADVMAGGEVDVLALGVISVKSKNGFEFEVGVFF
jgi:hypothetical protein